MEIPDGLDRNESELAELDHGILDGTKYRIIHDRDPTGSWYFVTDRRVVMTGGKVGTDWKLASAKYAEGYIDRQNQA